MNLRFPELLLVAAVFGVGARAATQDVPAAAAAGHALFSQSCVSCHGAAGEGGGDRGPALNTGTFVHGSSDADLFRAIRSGIRGTAMAPFGGLSDTQISQLVAYIRTLDRKSTRLNSSHANISYAVFCLKKKKKINK